MSSVQNFSTYAAILALLCSSSTFAEHTLKSYRIIRTSPHEFVSALRTMPRTQDAKAVASSRLARFFRIKNQNVQGGTIDFTIIPHLPLLSKYFDSITELKVHLSEQSQINEYFDYKMTVDTINKNKIHTRLVISPHPQGALLCIELIDSTYSDWTLVAFHAAAKAMGFLSESIEIAEKMESKDRQPPIAQEKK